MALKIFLSHSHHDQSIADPLAGLIQYFFGNKVNVRYSSDQKAGGGIPPGAPWLPWILEQITNADRTFVLLTPNSMHRPWVLWESGAAVGVGVGAGKETVVVPITFGMRDGDIPGPYFSEQAIRGDSGESGGIRRLLQSLNEALGGPLPDEVFESTVRARVPTFLDTIGKVLKSQVSPESVLASIPPLFPASKLQGLWATAYKFHSRGALAHHADISRLAASSDDRLRAVNYAPRTENHKNPFLNAIDLELANRHLVGQWKNRSDTRYFGAVHLAVLSGECVLEGHYTSLANDVETNVGRWKWVRLDTEIGDEALEGLRLQSPAAVHAVLDGHSASDGAIALDAILEKQ